MEHVNKVEILKALADDVRLGAVRALARAGGPVPGCEIVGSCAMSTKLSQPAMSHHFNKLVDAGVVSEEKRGTQKLYELNTALLKSIGIDVTKL